MYPFCRPVEYIYKYFSFLGPKYQSFIISFLKIELFNFFHKEMLNKPYFMVLNCGT